MHRVWGFAFEKYYDHVPEHQPTSKRINTMANEEVTFDPTLMDSLDEDTSALPQEFDPDADYNAPPPPLPDGWYQATLDCAGVKSEDGSSTVPFRKRPWGKIPSTFHTSIRAKIVDPDGPQDGKYATDNTVTTHADPKRHNTSKVATYYRGITGKPIPGVSEGQHMKALLEELQSTPLVWIRTQLEGQASDASKAFGEKKKAGGLAPGEKAPRTFRGEKAFLEDGVLTGRAWDETNQEWVVGRPVIADVKPIDFVPPTK
jgi:hypothetical protein